MDQSLACKKKKVEANNQTIERRAKEDPPKHKLICMLSFMYTKNMRKSSQKKTHEKNKQPNL